MHTVKEYRYKITELAVRSCAVISSQTTSVLGMSELDSRKRSDLSELKRGLSALSEGYARAKRDVRSRYDDAVYEALRSYSDECARSGYPSEAIRHRSGTGEDFCCLRWAPCRSQDRFGSVGCGACTSIDLAACYAVANSSPRVVPLFRLDWEEVFRRGTRLHDAVASGTSAYMSAREICLHPEFSRHLGNLRVVSGAAGLVHVDYTEEPDRTLDERFQRKCSAPSLSSALSEFSRRPWRSGRSGGLSVITAANHSAAIFHQPSHRADLVWLLDSKDAYGDGRASLLLFPGVRDLWSYLIRNFCSGGGGNYPREMHALERMQQEHGYDLSVVE